MTQTIFTAKEAKNNFGRLLDEVQVSPVTIEKNGRKVAVVTSYKEYEEDLVTEAFWKELEKSKRSGRVSSATVKKRLGL